MDLPDPPTAIFLSNDMMAVGAYDALKERGLRIPEDVSVVGYDDREIAQFMRPPLTTVVLPHYEMGLQAAETLIDGQLRPDGRQPQIKVECPLVDRDSVAPPRPRPLRRDAMLILVTGATGKVGRTLIDRLLADPAFGHARVRALCHNRALPASDRVEVVRGSIADRAAVEAAMRRRHPRRAPRHLQGDARGRHGRDGQGPVLADRGVPRQARPPAASC